MQFVKTDIPDVIVIKPKVFSDQRGFFAESYRKSYYRENGIDHDFVQDNLSRSSRGTIRGLHYQLINPQAKLVSVTRGRVLDVVVDVRKGSPTFGRYVAEELTSENKWMLYVPVGLAHGFCVLSDEADFYYKCSDYYNPDGERGIAWNDPDIGIKWPVTDPVLSDRDRQLPRLKDMDERDLPVYDQKISSGI
ncbi:MAG: dTDP-4-dehydrorhamnose 3,5-epimerase [Balneolaceae bacterium]|nr:MAG: dTDP-4-dehydrorhamnose 3,5-epimerase [Balneolaceae bacterium]